MDKDKVGHLFVVDTEFDHENADKKQLFFNEIYTPTFEKKVLFANERFVFQLLGAMRLNNKGTINSYKTTGKTYATMDKKFAIPLYTEYLHFLILRCRWKVSKVRAHCTFEQSKFKKEFVIMNQVSRQNAKTDVEKNFYKLTINSNFDYDSQNNADNCFFQPIYEKIEELSYAKRYQNVFDKDIKIVSSDILEQQIEEKFLNKFASLNLQDEYYEARKNSLEIKKKKVRFGIFYEKIHVKKA